MNILFVGNYRDGTGWAHAAVEYIRALDAAGVNVACRPVKLNAVEGEVHPRILELERAHYGHYDAVIQNVLPPHLDYNGRYPQNIALYYTETDSLGRTNWASRINLMDSAWVACEQGRAASIKGGVTVPLHPLPIPCDITKYQKQYKPLIIRKELGDQFIFYTIGEVSRRKNLRALLTAFHLEFDVNEPVSLLLKTTPPPGQDEWQAQQGLTRYCEEVKAGLKLFDDPGHYKREVVIAGRYSEEEMMRLHASCDCAVFASYGEAWSIPAFEAMALGKTPITPEWGGFSEYIIEYTGWPVGGRMEPAFGSDTFPDLHTSLENWFSVDISELRSAMREAYEDGQLREEKSMEGMDMSYEFRYEIIGKKMKEILENGR